MLEASSVVTRGQFGSLSKAFYTSLTGTDADSILDPTSGFKFRLKGFAISATVSTVLAGTGVSLFLCDMAAADTSFSAAEAIWPLAGFAADQAAGSVIRNDSNVVFIPKLSYRGSSRAYGYLSTAANNEIKIMANATISTGVIQISGVLFYDEEL